MIKSGIEILKNYAKDNRIILQEWSDYDIKYYCKVPFTAFAEQKNNLIVISDSATPTRKLYDILHELGHIKHYRNNGCEKFWRSMQDREEYYVEELLATLESFKIAKQLCIEVNKHAVNKHWIGSLRGYVKRLFGGYLPYYLPSPNDVFKVLFGELN